MSGGIGLVYLNFSALRSNNDADYVVNLRMPVNRRIISKYSSNRVISVLTPAARSRTRTIIDSPSRVRGEMVHALVPSPPVLLLFYRSTPPPYFSLAVACPFPPPLPPDFCLCLVYLFGNSVRIRGISYLAQIQSYEYNFPREQSFIVIVNPSVNCPALSITAVRWYNSGFVPLSLSFQPPSSYTVATIRRPRSHAVIHRGER